MTLTTWQETALVEDKKIIKTCIEQLSPFTPTAEIQTLPDFLSELFKTLAHECEVLDNIKDSEPGLLCARGHLPTQQVTEYKIILLLGLLLALTKLSVSYEIHPKDLDSAKRTSQYLSALPSKGIIAFTKEKDGQFFSAILTKPEIEILKSNLDKQIKEIYLPKPKYYSPNDPSYAFFTASKENSLLNESKEQETKGEEYYNALFEL